MTNSRKKQQKFFLAKPNKQTVAPQKGAPVVSNSSKLRSAGLTCLVITNSVAGLPTSTNINIQSDENTLVPVPPNVRSPSVRPPSLGTITEQDDQTIVAGTTDPSNTIVPVVTDSSNTIALIKPRSEEVTIPKAKTLKKITFRENRASKLRAEKNSAGRSDRKAAVDHMAELNQVTKELLDWTAKQAETNKSLSERWNISTKCRSPKNIYSITAKSEDQPAAKETKTKKPSGSGIHTKGTIASNAKITNPTKKRNDPKRWNFSTKYQNTLSQPARNSTTSTSKEPTLWNIPINPNSKAKSEEATTVNAETSKKTTASRNRASELRANCSFEDLGIRETLRIESRVTELQDETIRKELEKTLSTELQRANANPSFSSEELEEINRREQLYEDEMRSVPPICPILQGKD